MKVKRKVEVRKTNMIEDLPPVDLLVEDGVAHDDPACEDDQRRDEEADHTLPTDPQLLINCWVGKLKKKN